MTPVPCACSVLDCEEPYVELIVVHAYDDDGRIRYSADDEIQDGIVVWCLEACQRHGPEIRRRINDPAPDLFGLTITRTTEHPAPVVELTG